MNWFKERWEWFVGGILLLIGIFSSTKTNNKVNEKDLKIRLKTEKDIQKNQAKIRSNSEVEKNKIIKNHEKEKVQIKKEEKERIKELKDDPEALDAYLKSIGLQKK